MSELWGVWSGYYKEWRNKENGVVFAVHSKPLAIAQMMAWRKILEIEAKEKGRLAMRSKIKDIAAEWKKHNESLLAEAAGLCVRLFCEWAKSEGLIE